jgi:hypothetical protein
VAQFAPFQISSNCRRTSILFSSLLIECPPLPLEELPSSAPCRNFLWSSI